MIQVQKEHTHKKPSHLRISSITWKMTKFTTKTQTRRSFLLRRGKARNESSGDGPCSGFYRINSGAGFQTAGYVGTGRVGKVHRRSTSTGAGVPPLTGGARVPPLAPGARIPPFTAVPWIWARHCANRVEPNSLTEMAVPINVDCWELKEWTWIQVDDANVRRSQ